MIEVKKVKNKITTLLSLDSSTKDTGCAIYENGKYAYSRAIDVSNIKDGEQRMKEMIRSIYALFDEISPLIVVVELTSVMRNPDTQRKLTMVLGAIMGKCIECGAEFYSYRPTEWRSLVKNDKEKLPKKREELKQWAIDRCKVLGYEVTDDNEAEAILLGQAYINQWSGIGD